MNLQDMDFGNNSVRQLHGFAEHYASGWLLSLLTVTIAAVLISRINASQQPPSLMDPIAFVFNTLQFLLDNEKFMQRVK